jgi:ribosomal protein S18 acetylase RimI-like enzyme
MPARAAVFPTALNVRSAGSADYVAVSRLRNLLQAEGRARRPDIYRARFLEDTAALFQSVLADPSETILVAESGADGGTGVVGYVWFYIGDGTGSAVSFPRRFAVIHHLTVDPAYLRRGIGRALMAAAEAAAIADGVEVLTLNVDATNHDARAFYDRVGVGAAAEFRTKLLRQVRRFDAE